MKLLDRIIIMKREGKPPIYMILGQDGGSSHQLVGSLFFFIEVKKALYRLVYYYRGF